MAGWQCLSLQPTRTAPFYPDIDGTLFPCDRRILSEIRLDLVSQPTFLCRHGSQLDTGRGFRCLRGPILSPTGHSQGSDRFKHRLQVGCTSSHFTWTSQSGNKPPLTLVFRHDKHPLRDLDFLCSGSSSTGELVLIWNSVG